MVGSIVFDIEDTIEFYAQLIDGEHEYCFFSCHKQHEVTSHRSHISLVNVYEDFTEGGIISKNYVTFTFPKFVKIWILSVALLKRYNLWKESTHLGWTIKTHFQGVTLPLIFVLCKVSLNMITGAEKFIAERALTSNIFYKNKYLKFKE